MTSSLHNQSNDKEPFLSAMTSHVALSAAEHKSGKRSLLKFIAENKTHSSNHPSYLSPHPFIHWRYALAAICTGAVLGGSTLGASAYSLPGDTLYPVKINITEELSYLIAWNPEARAKLSSERLSRRMTEMVFLRSNHSTATIDDWEMLSDSFAYASLETAEDIVDLSESEREITAATIADELASAADTYEQHLRDITKTESLAIDTGLILQIDTVGDQMDVLFESIATDAVHIPATEAEEEETAEVIEDAVNDLEEVQDLFEIIDLEEQHEASTTLHEAEESLADAQSAAEKGDSKEAFDHLQTARDAIEAVEAVIDLSTLSPDPVDFPDEVTATDTNEEQ
jgi:hypothetical protein